MAGSEDTRPLSNREIAMYQANVLRGVERLDAFDADWWKKKNGTVFERSIDIADINMADTHCCILGQLDGYYRKGTNRLWPDASEDDHQELAARHGFDVRPNGFPLAPRYSLLGEPWLDVIRARRSPRSKRPEWLAGKV